MPPHQSYFKTVIRLPGVFYRYLAGTAAFHVQCVRLRIERGRPSGDREPPGPRVIASAGWFFPVYSHTFVYQELTQLVHAGFRLKFFYGSINDADTLSAQFDPLWRVRHRLAFHPAVCRRSIRFFRRHAPERFEALVASMATQSGLSRAAVLTHPHVGQACAFARLARAWKPDYLHSYFFYQDSVYALATSMLLGVPRGVSCYADHMLDDYELKLVPLHLRQASVVIATSQRIRQELLAIEPATPSARILVKVNAINADHFPAVERTAPAPGAPFVLVSLSRIEPKKGLVYLLEALHRLRTQGRRVEWVMIGGVDDNAASGGYAEGVRQRIAELGLESAVRMAGRQSEAAINAAFSAAHLFVAPFVETESGDKDGVPTALLEAMASGLPVVATDAGSIPEVVDDSRTGVLVRQRDADALAAAVAALMDDEPRRRRLGAAGAAAVRERFDVRVCDHVFHARVSQLVAAVSTTTTAGQQVAP